MLCLVLATLHTHFSLDRVRFECVPEFEQLIVPQDRRPLRSTGLAAPVRQFPQSVHYRFSQLESRLGEPTEHPSNEVEGAAKEILVVETEPREKFLERTCERDDH